MKVNNFIKVSTVDYPGVLATVVFTKGCNLRCPYCYNSELMSSSDEDDISIRTELFDWLEKRKHMIEGVVISGGEPLYQDYQYMDIQGTDVIRFCERIKEIGDFKIKLDTNGTYPDQLKSIIQSGYLDYVAMDIKTDPLQYYQTHLLTRKDIYSQIFLSIDMIMDSGIDYEFRTTCVHPVVDPVNFNHIGPHVKDAQAYYLQNYRFMESVARPQYLYPFTMEEFMESKEILLKYTPNVEIRGLKNTL